MQDQDSADLHEAAGLTDALQQVPLLSGDEKLNGTRPASERASGPD